MWIGDFYWFQHRQIDASASTREFFLNWRTLYVKASSPTFSEFNRKWQHSVNLLDCLEILISGKVVIKLSMFWAFIITYISQLRLLLQMSPFYPNLKLSRFH